MTTLGTNSKQFVRGSIPEAGGNFEYTGEYIELSCTRICYAVEGLNSTVQFRPWHHHFAILLILTAADQCGLSAPPVPGDQRAQLS
jgi:hypothetical protein